MFQTMPSRPVEALVMPAVNCMNAVLPFSVGVHSITNRARPVSLARAICGQRKRRQDGIRRGNLPVKWGFTGGILTTLSGPPAALGVQQRNGFQLALKTLGGKLGGREVELIVQDDELKPDVAVGKAKALTERDKVDFVVGPVFSNILIAMMKPVTDGGAILISPNAGTSNFAGKDCNANFFVTSYQNDQPHEVSGKYAQDKGFKKVFIMAPNYQAGKDSLNGFKRYFKGDVVDEVYVPLG